MIRHIVIKTETLADLLANNLGLWAWCRDCSRSKILDVLALSLAYGEKTRRVDVAHKLKCEQCGGRNCDLNIKWPTW